MALKVYKSSAGSGKTYTLVLEYLGLVLKNPSKYRHILAVTFTNKAANEMKERIVNSLADLSNPVNRELPYIVNLVENLTSRFQLEEANIYENSGIVFRSLLHNYSDFAVSTIDSFVYKLIRGFARDLDLPSRFEPELDDKHIASLIHQELISKIGEDQRITNLMMDWIFTRMNQDESWNVDSEINSFINELHKEHSFYGAGDILSAEDFNEVENELRIYIQEKENQLSERATTIIRLFNDEEIELTDMRNGKTGLAARINEIKNKDIKTAFGKPSFIQWLDGEHGLFAVAKRNELGAIGQTIEDAVEPHRVYFSEFYTNDFTIYNFRKILLSQLYVLQLMEAIREISNGIIADDQIIHISEFNKRIAALVSETAIPFIYERIGEKYHHFLIDEFQDTSILQWQNFLPLIDNSLASGHMNLIVGDAKQAIYRFRGGEVEQFVKLPEIHHTTGLPPDQNWEQTLIAAYQEHNLTTNYRSEKEIVDFNNQFFKYLKDNFLSENLQDIFDGHTQKYLPKHDGGYVQIQFLPNNREAFEKETNTQVLELVNRLTTQDGFNLKDIAILTSTKAEGNTIALELSNNDIPVVSSDSLLLAASSKIRLILSLLRLLVFPEDTSNYLLFLDLLLSFRDVQDKNGALNDVLIQLSEQANENQAAFVRDYSGIDFTALEGLDVYDAVSRCIDDFEFDTPVDPYIIAFLEEVYRFSQKYGTGIAEFIAYWDKRMSNSSLVLPEHTDAIRIMTIHKAKGLEFPVVIYPYADSELSSYFSERQWIDFGDHAVENLKTGLLKLTADLKNTPFGEYVDKNQENRKLDLINRLYVVLTRAEKQLYIFTKQLESTGTNNFKLPIFFKDYLNNLGLWNEEQKVYRFGTEQNNLQETQTDEVVDSTFSGLNPDWYRSLKVKTAQFELPDINKENPGQRGTAIHECLADISDINSVQSVLQQYQHLNRISSDDILMLNSFFENLSDYPIVNECFKPGNKSGREVELLANNGTVLRIDRINHFDDRIVLLDFKTGTYTTDHHLQLAAYKEEVAGLEPLPIKAYLVYLAESIEVKEV